jgi:TPP-dependent 2-oxoacid decarboxylase
VFLLSCQPNCAAACLCRDADIGSCSIVLNNHGYTVERWFLGMHADYNDVPLWNYGGLYKAFAPHVDLKTYEVRTAAEFEKLLSDKAFSEATEPQVSWHTLLS